MIPEDGFIYIFVQNESPLDVYFDNLHITHKKSNVLEINEYYPYGLKNLSMSQASLSFDPVNSLSYQSKEQQDFLGLNTLDFGLRQYDATIGRWNVQDPYMQFFNAYIGMGNNPVSQIDPNGGITHLVNRLPTMDDMMNGSEYNRPSKGGIGDFGKSGTPWYALSSFEQRDILNANGMSNIQFHKTAETSAMALVGSISFADDGTVIVSIDNPYVSQLVGNSNNSSSSNESTSTSNNSNAETSPSELINKGDGSVPANESIVSVPQSHGTFNNQDLSLSIYDGENDVWYNYQEPVMFTGFAFDPNALNNGYSFIDGLARRSIIRDTPIPLLTVQDPDARTKAINNNLSIWNRDYVVMESRTKQQSNNNISVFLGIPRRRPNFNVERRVNYIGGIFTVNVWP